MTNLFCRPRIRQPVVRSHFVCTNDENDEMLKYFNVYFYFRSMTSNSVDLYENSSSFVISSGFKPWSFRCLVESSHCKCTNYKISMNTRRPPARAPSPPCTHCSSATRSTRRGQFPNRRPSRPYLASGGPLPLGLLSSSSHFSMNPFFLPFLKMPFSSTKESSRYRLTKAASLNLAISPVVP